MNKETIIRNLVDYILLNAYSINSSGFYNGKAGISLVLFKVAAYLEDEYIEEQAFELLQEALLSNTDDISFENGLSGIGYVLMDLIDNNFIDADFDELFNEQYEKIITSFEKRKDNPNWLLNSILMTHFFIKAKSIKPTDKRLDNIIKSIFEATELYLAIQFFDIQDINYINNKSKVLNTFEIYLETIYKCNYIDYSRVVLDDYAKAYRNGAFVSSYKVAYCLEKLNLQKKYKKIIEENKKYTEVIYTNHLSLKEQIEFSKATNNNLILDILKSKDKQKIEKDIFYSIPKNIFIAGYEQGIGNLLIYLVEGNK